MDAMKTAVMIGISPIEFWELTPNEFFVMIDAYIERKKFESEEKITLAYINSLWTAQFTLMMLSKRRPPKLDEILKKKKQMTPKEMLAQVKILNAFFGGKVKITGKEGEKNGNKKHIDPRRR